MPQDGMAFSASGAAATIPASAISSAASAGFWLENSAEASTSASSSVTAAGCSSANSWRTTRTPVTSSEPGVTAAHSSVRRSAVRTPGFCVVTTVTKGWGSTAIAPGVVASRAATSVASLRYSTMTSVPGSSPLLRSTWLSTCSGVVPLPVLITVRPWRSAIDVISSPASTTSSTPSVVIAATAIPGEPASRSLACTTAARLAGMSAASTCPWTSWGTISSAVPYIAASKRSDPAAGSAFASRRRPTRPIVVGPLSDARRTVTCSTGAGPGALASVGTASGDAAATVDGASAVGPAHPAKRTAAPTRAVSERVRNDTSYRPGGRGGLRQVVGPEGGVGGVQQVVRALGAGLAVEVLVQAQQVGVVLGLAHGRAQVDVHEHLLARGHLAVMVRGGLSGGSLPARTWATTSPATIRRTSGSTLLSPEITATRTLAPPAVTVASLMPSSPRTSWKSSAWA